MNKNRGVAMLQQDRKHAEKQRHGNVAARQEAPPGGQQHTHTDTHPSFVHCIREHFGMLRLLTLRNKKRRLEILELKYPGAWCPLLYKQSTLHLHTAPAKDEDEWEDG